MSLLYHSCPSELWVTTQSQRNQLDTERGFVCVCSTMSKWVREREIIFITNWLHFHTASSSPQGWNWRAKYCQHKHTDIRTHTHTLAHTNTQSQMKRVSSEELQQWSECRRRWHTTAVADWLISISITQPSDIAVHIVGHTHAHTERQTHMTTCTGLVHTRTLYAMNSHQPLLWAVHRWLQTQSKEDRDR